FALHTIAEPATPMPASDRPPENTVLKVRREEIHRTIVLLIDDLQLDFESLQRARRAVDRFIDETLAPGDLVAVVHTAEGSGFLQQFTSDKRQLHAVAAGVRAGAAPAIAGGAVPVEDLQASSEDAPPAADHGPPDVDPHKI